MKNKHIQRTVLAALFAALICVATLFFSFPLPGNGYANLGDTFIIAAAFFLGPVYGFAAAGIGSMLADILLSYVIYAPATFLIKGLMAVVFALICRGITEHSAPKRVLRLVIGAVAAELLMVGGYFLFECILYSSATAIADVPGNLIQGLIGFILGSVVVNLLSANRQIRKLSGLSQNV